jgi:hypothetical protein
MTEGGRILYEAYWETGPSSAPLWHELSASEQDRWIATWETWADEE